MNARLLLGCLVLGVGLVPGQAWAQSLAPVEARQLVMPFENSAREPRGYWLSEGSAVLLSDDLARLGAHALPRDRRIALFADRGIPPLATLSHASAIRIGRTVGVAQVVVGSFELGEETIAVHARAIRLDTGQLLPEIVETGSLTDLFGIYARVARRLLPDSRVTDAALAQARPPLPAFEQFIKGLLAEAPVTRAAFLTEAMRLAPAFQRPRLALWAVHAGEGAHRQALDVVRQVPADDPLARLARFRGATSMIHLGQYPQAFETLTGLNRELEDPALLNNLGIVQLRSPAGVPGSRAVGFFAEAARLDPRDSDLFFNLGYAALLSDDLFGAIAAMREVVRRDPADAAAHYLLGAALGRTGSPAEAARERDLAGRLSPLADVWANTAGPGAVPRGLERFKASLDAVDEPRGDDILVSTEQRDPRELAVIHLAAGRRLVEEERDLEAITEFRRAVYLAPYEGEVHLRLGQAYLRVGRLNDGIDALKVSVWSDDTPVARLALAGGYVQARREPEARAELARVLVVDPDNMEARRLLAGLAAP